MMNDIITGEKIQELCDMYIGHPHDFEFNPFINKDKHKHININTITDEFDNVKYIFCYSHLIPDISSKIKYFKNNFILITHNSDYIIEDNNEYVKTILNCNKLIKWYSQNIIFEHNKLSLLPIGFANRMWPHGNLSPFNDKHFIHQSINKTNNIYFNFNIHTNFTKRKKCYDDLIHKIQWLDNIHPVLNLHRLKTFQFCICPEGNGVDTHRLWECLYLKVVPIVINTPFTKILKKYNVPLVILNNWSDIFTTHLSYEQYDFNDNTFLDLISFNKLADNIKSINPQ
jgi:hypothetical protein